MKPSCPFNNLNCFRVCQFYNDEELKTTKGKLTHCVILAAASVISELKPEAINALCKAVEDKKE